ncbi:MAG: DEAD/DEAH box helicase [Bacteriovoracaceae bacterium]|nr:DEAD/DEAH box helicase [Bacteriovoracaceae bacterium]
MRNHFEKLLSKKSHDFLLIVDESFYYKDADAKRTKDIFYLRPLVKRCLVLCGTPAPNSAMDIVEQINLADGGEAFSNSFSKLSYEEIVKVVESRALYLRQTKEEVLSLPGRTIHKMHIEMESCQREIYDKVHDEVIQKLNNTSQEQFRKSITSFLAKRAYLLQICSNPIAVDESYSEVPAKVKEIEKLLNELIIKKSEKVIIWSFYRKSIDFMMNYFKKYNPLRFDGSINSTEERGEIVTKFQENENYNLIIANPAAAGAGVTLHSARSAIYESMSNQTAHFLQSLDRIHRRGQSKEVDYYFLITSNSLEKRNIDVLLRKLDDSKALLSDPEMEILTKEVFMEKLS